MVLVQLLKTVNDSMLEVIHQRISSLTTLGPINLAHAKGSQGFRTFIPSGNPHAVLHNNIIMVHIYSACSLDIIFYSVINCVFQISFHCIYSDHAVGCGEYRYSLEDTPHSIPICVKTSDRSCNCTKVTTVSEL